MKPFSAERLFRWLGILEPEDKLVLIKNWLPIIDGFEILWPVLLIDRKGHQRMTIFPLWDWNRVKAFFITPKPLWDPNAIQDVTSPTATPWWSDSGNYKRPWDDTGP